MGSTPDTDRLLHEPETPNPAQCGAGVGILALQGGEDVKCPEAVSRTGCPSVSPGVGGQ